mgnify:CR=1 FL=1
MSDNRLSIQEGKGSRGTAHETDCIFRAGPDAGLLRRGEPVRGGWARRAAHGLGADFGGLPCLGPQGTLAHALRLHSGGGEQRRAVGFYRDPHEAQEVRTSQRPADQRFWETYKAYADRAERVCT